MIWVMNCTPQACPLEGIKGDGCNPRAQLGRIVRALGTGAKIDNAESCVFSGQGSESEMHWLHDNALVEAREPLDSPPRSRMSRSYVRAWCRPHACGSSF